MLYRLIVNPDYLEPLRQEIESAVAEEGWTKAGMDKLHKLDSFLQETQRIDITNLGWLASFHDSVIALTCSLSGGHSSRSTPIHIFERCDRPSGDTTSRSGLCLSTWMKKYMQTLNNLTAFISRRPMTLTAIL